MLILTGIVLLIAISACTWTEIPPAEIPPDEKIPESSKSPEVPVSEDYSVKYLESEGKLVYSAKVTLPTPCYSIEKEELVMESMPPQVRIELTRIPPDADVVCIQVIAEETVEGEVDVGVLPGAVTIYFNEKQVYSTTNIRVE